ncbi:protein of unknown function [Shinella sp. WSC3-e]|nr:hypothetical protein SHINE37_42221 [Rhizobiaceae bacterium]CAK7256814.1 protein of unknown function [Shinella sp. WSC3-e]
MTTRSPTRKGRDGSEEKYPLESWGADANAPLTLCHSLFARNIRGAGIGPTHPVVMITTV